MNRCVHRTAPTRPRKLLSAGSGRIADDALRRRTAIRSALAGVNATVVGLLLAAVYTPVWTSAMFAPADFAIGIVAFLLLAMWRVPPWLVVVLGAATASIVAVIPG